MSKITATRTMGPPPPLPSNSALRRECHVTRLLMICTSPFTASPAPLPRLAPYLQNTKHSQTCPIFNAGEGTRDGKQDLWAPCPLTSSTASPSQSPPHLSLPCSLQSRAHPTPQPKLGFLLCSTGLYVCILGYLFK